MTTPKTIETVARVTEVATTRLSIAGGQNGGPRRGVMHIDSDMLSATIDLDEEQLRTHLARSGYDALVTIEFVRRSV